MRVNRPFIISDSASASRVSVARVNDVEEKVVLDE
jgi:hypothetical protein